MEVNPVCGYDPTPQLFVDMPGIEPVPLAPKRETLVTRLRYYTLLSTQPYVFV